MLGTIRQHVIIFAAIFSVICWITIAALIYQGDSSQSTTDEYPLDKACYSLTDQSGIVYKSWFPPEHVAGAGNVFTFNSDHRWGFVFNPSAMVADRDCLRERYPGDTIVPALEGEDK